MLILLIVAAQLVSGQGVSGTWRTIDDKTGQAKAVVEIYRKEDRLYGQIRRILVKGREDARCEDCPGSLEGKPLLGMQILGGLKKTGKYSWEGDTLFDPEQGRFFRCRIWLDPKMPDELKVRGYWMIFHRTQTWKRVPQPM